MFPKQGLTYFQRDLRQFQPAFEIYRRQFSSIGISSNFTWIDMKFNICKSLQTCSSMTVGFHKFKVLTPKARAARADTIQPRLQAGPARIVRLSTVVVVLSPQA